jgi:hypothetical protein
VAPAEIEHHLEAKQSIPGKMLTMRGASTRFVQRLMRHSDPRMTERYSHFDPEYLHSKLDELMRFQPAKPTTDPEPVAAVAAAWPRPRP